MSDELLKVTDDLWCLWSHIADGPKVWGDRQEVFDWMLRFSSTRPPCPHCGHHEINDRFERAEAKGTSMQGADGPPSGFVYNQLGWLPWERLEAFLKSYDIARYEFNGSLLDPFEES